MPMMKYYVIGIIVKCKFGTLDLVLRPIFESFASMLDEYLRGAGEDYQKMFQLKKNYKSS